MYVTLGECKNYVRLCEALVDHETKVAGHQQRIYLRTVIDPEVERKDQGAVAEILEEGLGWRILQDQAVLISALDQDIAHQCCR